MEFPYLFRKDKRYPIIPIKLSKGSLVLKTEALVDSGANISVFSSDIADYLGIELTSGKKIYLQKNKLLLKSNKPKKIQRK